MFFGCFVMSVSHCDPSMVVPSVDTCANISTSFFRTCIFHLAQTYLVFLYLHFPPPGTWFFRTCIFIRPILTLCSCWLDQSVQIEFSLRPDIWSYLEDQTEFWTDLEDKTECLSSLERFMLYCGAVSLVGHVDVSWQTSQTDQVAAQQVVGFIQCHIVFDSVRNSLGTGEFYTF